MFDNRQRTKADFLLDVVVAPGVTVTPTFKYKDDYYPLNTATGAPVGTLAEGLSDQKMISGGVDVAWVVTPGLSIVASYYYEYYHQNLYSGTSNAFSNRCDSRHHHRQRVREYRYGGGEMGGDTEYARL